jgi:hypothetical protein
MPRSHRYGCGLDLDTLGVDLSGCVPTDRPGGKNTGCPSHDLVHPFSYSLPGCCSNGLCGYLDEELGIFGCMDASSFGEVGEDC